MEPETEKLYALAKMPKDSEFGKVSRKWRREARQLVSHTLVDLWYEPASGLPPVRRIASRMGLDPKNSTVGAVMLVCAYYEAMTGNAAYLREIVERIDGKAPETINIIARKTVKEMSEEELDAMIEAHLERRTRPDSHA